MRKAGRDIRFSGCHADRNFEGFTIIGDSDSAYELTSLTLINCLSTENKHHGFFISGAKAKGINIVGCTASNNSTDPLITYSGCYVNTNFKGGVLITGNRFGNFIYTGTEKQKYGIVIASDADNVIATSNDLRGNETGGLLNASSGTNIILANNLLLGQY